MSFFSGGRGRGESQAIYMFNLDLLKVVGKKKHIPQMVVYWWFTMVESVNNHLSLKQILGYCQLPSGCFQCFFKYVFTLISRCFFRWANSKLKKNNKKKHILNTSPIQPPWNFQEMKQVHWVKFEKNLQFFKQWKLCFHQFPVLQTELSRIITFLVSVLSFFNLHFVTHINWVWGWIDRSNLDRTHTQKSPIFISYESRRKTLLLSNCIGCLIGIILMVYYI